MNISKWNKLYENNKRLDQIFLNKYKNDDRLFEKNCIEFLVEIGEFINETKVFKYWTKKHPNKEKMLDEYADVITMILTFYGELNLDFIDIEDKIKEDDIIKLIQHLFEIASKVKSELNEKNIRYIFLLVIHLGNLLNITEEEILDAITSKQKIIEERLNSDY